MRTTRPLLAVTALSAQLFAQTAARAEVPAETTVTAPPALFDEARRLLASIVERIEASGAPAAAPQPASPTSVVAPPLAPEPARASPCGNGKRACFDDEPGS